MPAAKPAPNNPPRAGGLMVAPDVGSARVACAVAEIAPGRRPVIVAAETSASYGIRGGEVVDIARASESIRIAIDAAAERAEAEVRTVVVGLSGDVKLNTQRACMELDKERRTVMPNDAARLRGALQGDPASGRRVIHRFDGPYTVGDLNGIEHPEGLSGDRLEMQASFLTTASDRLDNVLKAVRGAGVDIEAVALEPLSSLLGALSPDERGMGALVLDFGAGAFRGALWEGGRLRQIHVAGRDGGMTKSGRCVVPPGSPVGGMEGVVLALAQRFRIAPATASRLLKSHAALGESEAADLPPFAEVAAVDGLGNVRVETAELCRTLEELIAPAARSLRETLSGFTPAHAGGVVLTGGGARIRGLVPWIVKRFGGAPVRLGVPRWDVSDAPRAPSDLLGSAGCSLAGLLSFGAEGRLRVKPRRVTALLDRVSEGLRRLTASF